MIDGRRSKKKIAIATVPVVFIMITLSVVTSFAATTVSHGSFSLLKSYANENQSALNYWYVGASSSNSTFLQNNGIRSEIQVLPQNVSSFLAFWVSETMSNNLWGQVGYYIFHNSRPVAFYQVWNLSTKSEITSGTIDVSFGDHLFSMFLTKGTIFQFSVDSQKIGYYNMLTNGSSRTDPVFALSEEGYCSSPFSFEPVAFSAMQVLQGGDWLRITSAESYGNAWGMAGVAQSQFIVGGNYSSLLEGTSLW